MQRLIINENIINLIKKRASRSATTAKTLRGLLRAAVSVPFDPYTFGVGLRGKWSPEPEVLSQDERDIRRCKADKEYRKAYLAKLRAKLRKLQTPPVADVNVISEYSAQRENRRLAYGYGCEVYYRITGKLWPERLPEAPAVLLSISEQFCRDRKIPVDMRGKNARIESCFEPSNREYISGHTVWKRGRPVDYIRITNINYIRSFAIVQGNGRFCDVALHDDCYQLSAPDGWEFARDTNGICLRKTDNSDIDYHFDAIEAWEMRTDIEGFCRRASERYETRQTFLKTTFLPTVFVRFCDSIAAGNCKEGTLNWCKKEGLNHKTYISADKLSRFADNSRVVAAVSAAAQRQEAEMRQGFCQL